MKATDSLLPGAGTRWPSSMCRTVSYRIQHGAQHALVGGQPADCDARDAREAQPFSEVSAGEGRIALEGSCGVVVSLDAVAAVDLQPCDGERALQRMRGACAQLGESIVLLPA